jgi:SpoVK/Ycf46/Vps4 family AAA+-type ATPase
MSEHGIAAVKNGNGALPGLVLSEPLRAEDTGIDFGLLLDLCMKTIYSAGRPAARLIATRMGLSFPVVEELLAFLRRQEYLEIVGANSVSETDYQYVLTAKGVAKTREVLEANQYVGAAPVPLDVYMDVVRRQTVRHIAPTKGALEGALNQLVLAPETMSQLGVAVASASSVFIYGESGNGKSTIATAIGHIPNDTILVPHAVEVYGQVVRVYDPRVHLAPEGSSPTETQDGLMNWDRDIVSGHDRRWVHSRRPVITVGGELTLEELELRFSETAKFYVAPIQVKANGGVLVVDDFGRQLVRPQQLLNRWMVPMERGFDHLTFHTGETVEVPFDVLLIFATNLVPSQLGDDAFYRRIRHKVRIPDPTREEFRQILKHAARATGIAYNDAGARYLMEKYYEQDGRALRGVHPRDIFNLLLDIGKYRGQAPQFDQEWIDLACGSYFVTD